MEMPKPTKDHEKLYRFAGSWIVEETMHPSPGGPGGKATARMNAKVDVDGMFVVQDYVQEMNGQTSFRGHGIFGVDPKTGRVGWYWVHSMGFLSPAPFWGTWQGDTLVLEHQGPEMHGRYSFRFEGDRLYYFTLEGSRDGKQWSTFKEATYRKQG